MERPKFTRGLKMEMGWDGGAEMDRDQHYATREVLLQDQVQDS